MTENINILNVGFPKVGNTWIGRTLSYALNAEFREYDNEGNIFLGTKSQDILKKTGGKIDGREKTNIGIVEKTHHLPHQWKNWDKDHILKIIYIGRDPRDVSVSFFYYQYYHRPYKENGKIKKYNYLERKKFIFNTIYSYYVHKALWKPYTSYFITYENLWNDTYEALENLLINLKISFDKDNLKEAIRYFSWNNMSKVRKQGDTNNKEFMRSGIIGSFKKEFDMIDYVSYYMAYLLSIIFIIKRYFYPKIYKNLDVY